ncbi:MAG: hypothetical protein RR443_07290 [Anaerorhabdus sp.]|uniref:hypothetical protein n=1 Tax=Anaerorhabdus sp. TaxID=1872524 RepID=UPI002FC61862
MEFNLNNFFKKEWNFKFIRLSTLDILLLCLITILGLYGRYKLFPFQSEDYIQNLQHWYNQLASTGGIVGIKNLVGNYTPPYTYLLALLTYLPFSSLTSIKLLSVCCDFLLCIVVALITFKITNSKNKSVLTYTITFMLPSVILNSALWAQCDSLIMLFMAICILFFLHNKPVGGCISFGIALAFKVQSIFIAPVFLLLLLHKKVDFKHLLLIPLVYLISVVPTALMGGNYFDALSVVYYQVTTTATDLSFNCANIWSALRGINSPDLGSFGTMLALSATLICAYILIIKVKVLDNTTLFLCFLFFVLIIPYLLPYMHERYYYYAEVLAIIYAIINPKRFYVPLVIVAVSVLSYLPFLFNVEPIPLTVLSLAILVILSIITYDLFVVKS